MQALKMPLRDAQCETPVCFCRKCGGEVYYGEWEQTYRWTGLCEECMENADNK